MKTCVYCGSLLIKKSKEHIIHNAIGGLYESEDICCDNCNKFISKNIDAPFTKIFNPIIAQIPNICKSHNKGSSPTYFGYALNKESRKVIGVKLKKNKIYGSDTLSKEKHRELKQSDFDNLILLATDFRLENKFFKTGISKIAFNFAIDKRIPFELLKDKLSIILKDDKKQGKKVLEDLKFKNYVLPYYPLTPFDRFMEFDSGLPLYHALCLFNINTDLWCYVDLFNTFKYYVHLSDNWDGNEIHETYLQAIQKEDHTVPEIHIRNVKDALIYAQQFGVKYSADENVLQKRISDKIAKKTPVKDFCEFLNYGIDKIELTNISKYGDKASFLRSLQFYVDSKDCLLINRYKRYVPLQTNEIASYPDSLNHLLVERLLDVREFGYKKFDMLIEKLAEMISK